MRGGSTPAPFRSFLKIPCNLHLDRLSSPSWGWLACRYGMLLWVSSLSGFSNDMSRPAGSLIQSSNHTDYVPLDANSYRKVSYLLTYPGARQDSCLLGQKDDFPVYLRHPNVENQCGYVTRYISIDISGPNNFEVDSEKLHRWLTIRLISFLLVLVLIGTAHPAKRQSTNCSQSPIDYHQLYLLLERTSAWKISLISPYLKRWLSPNTHSGFHDPSTRTLSQACMFLSPCAPFFLRVV